MMKDYKIGCVDDYAIQITKDDFSDGLNSMIKRVAAWMKVPGHVAPKIVYTSLNSTDYVTYAKYQDMKARYVAWYDENKVWPTFVWVTRDGKSPTTVETIPADIQQYLKVSKNCQSTDTVIVTAAKAIVGTSTSLKDKATKIFNWVRDNTSYTFYSNTKYGALKAYTVRLMNCCDMAHLVNALARAVSVPARYLHVNAKFSSGTYGHVVAQLYTGTWQNADATDNDNTLGNVTNWKLVSTKGTYRELPF